MESHKGGTLTHLGNVTRDHLLISHKRVRFNLLQSHVPILLLQLPRRRLRSTLHYSVPVPPLPHSKEHRMLTLSRSLPCQTSHVGVLTAGNGGEGRGELGAGGALAPTVTAAVGDRDGIGEDSRRFAELGEQEVVGFRLIGLGLESAARGEALGTSARLFVPIVYCKILCGTLCWLIFEDLFLICEIEVTTDSLEDR